MQEQHTIILNPSAPAGRAISAPRQTLKGFKGKVVGFIDNSKPNFNLLADDIAELLVQQHGAARVVRHRKRTASEGASDAVLQDIKDNCDVVITGSGD